MEGCMPGACRGHSASLEIMQECSSCNGKHVALPKDGFEVERRDFVLESAQWKEVWAIPEEHKGLWNRPWRRDYQADAPRKPVKDPKLHKSRRDKLAEHARALMKASELAQWCGHARPFPWPWVWMENGYSLQCIPQLGVHVPVGWR